MFEYCDQNKIYEYLSSANFMYLNRHLTHHGDDQNLLLHRRCWGKFLSIIKPNTKVLALTCMY